MSTHDDIPHGSTTPPIRLGVAGWKVRREHASRFSDTGSHLARYATQFNAVEINSCFHRPHRRATYERWAATVPPDFRFAVKLSKVITHANRFVDIVAPLERFLVEYRVGRVAADPACVPAAAEPGGYGGIMYLRLHGSPRVYYSGYPSDYPADVAQLLDAGASRDILAWCIFDNTTLGAATVDALTVKSHLLSRQRVTT